MTSSDVDDTPAIRDAPAKFLRRCARCWFRRASLPNTDAALVLVVSGLSAVQLSPARADTCAPNPIVCENAKTGNPVVSAQHFLHELDTPEFPWTGLTIFLLIAVFAAAVGTRLLQLRSKRSAPSDNTAATTVPDPDTAV